MVVAGIPLGDAGGGDPSRGVGVVQTVLGGEGDRDH